MVKFSFGKDLSLNFEQVVEWALILANTRLSNGSSDYTMTQAIKEILDGISNGLNGVEPNGVSDS